MVEPLKPNRMQFGLVALLAAVGVIAALLVLAKVWPELALGLAAGLMLVAFVPVPGSPLFEFVAGQLERAAEQHAWAVLALPLWILLSWAITFSMPVVLLALIWAYLSANP